MSDRADIRSPRYSDGQMTSPKATNSNAWEKVRLVASRAIFWSYDRGSWQYDVIVVLILAFIFFAPATWFHDRPQLQLTDLRHVPGIVELSHGKNSWTFEVDARLVPSSSAPEARQSIQELLRPRFKGSMTITSVTPILDPHGVVLGYNVAVTSP
jgi:hypothetical protein